MSEECVVKDCTNRTNQGGFVGEICTPCYEFITEGTGKFSQAYRNAQKEWQGLSYDEMKQLSTDAYIYEGNDIDLIKRTEAMLKEKNNGSDVG